MQAYVGIDKEYRQVFVTLVSWRGCLHGQINTQIWTIFNVLISAKIW